MAKFYARRYRADVFDCPDEGAHALPGLIFALTAPKFCAIIHSIFGELALEQAERKLVSFDPAIPEFG